jgi:hypothetical protein
MTGMPVSLGFSKLRGIRFTLALGETITIGARGVEIGRRTRCGRGFIRRRRHPTPPSLAFGAPDDGRKRVIQDAAPSRADRNASGIGIARRSRSSGDAQAVDQVTGDDGRGLS